MISRENLEKTITRHIEELNRIISNTSSLLNVKPEIFTAKSNALLALSNIVAKEDQEKRRF